jgi:hypothetical protein
MVLFHGFRDLGLSVAQTNGQERPEEHNKNCRRPNLGHCRLTLPVNQNSLSELQNDFVLTSKWCLFMGSGIFGFQWHKPMAKSAQRSTIKIVAVQTLVIAH